MANKIGPLIYEIKSLYKICPPSVWMAGIVFSSNKCYAWASNRS